MTSEWRYRHAEVNVIPAACGVMGFLGGGEELECRNHVTEIAGFDLSPFNEFAPTQFSVRRQNYPYHRYSDDFEACVFDLAKDRHFPAETKTLRVAVTQTGRCHGVVQWIKCWLDDTTTFENHPDLPNPNSGWFSKVVVLAYGKFGLPAMRTSIL